MTFSSLTSPGQADLRQQSNLEAPCDGPRMDVRKEGATKLDDVKGFMAERRAGIEDPALLDLIGSVCGAVLYLPA